MEKRLLLVDDEEDIRDILDLYLSDMGYEVQTAADGLSAWEQFQALRHPIVITDIKMPGINGIELLRKIKTDSPDTEVIMITGHGDLDLAVESLKYQATDFITKPINQDMLEAALNRAYEKVSLREQVRAYNENLQQMVQEELRTARHKYHQLFEASPCFISVQDREFRITESNHLFKKHFGEESGLFCYSSYKHRSRPCTNCPVAKTFEDEKSHQAETVVTSKNGQQYHVLITTAPIRDSEGKITHVMEMSTDITQIRQLQDQLTSLGLLIGSVSHSMKGLLTGLDGGMYLLSAGIRKEKTDQIEEGLEIVQEMGKRIRKQVLDILYYAKNREPDWQPVDAGELARSIFKTVKPKADNQGVDFHLELPDAPGEIEAEEDVVSAALVNILENAVDACSEKSASDSSPAVRFSLESSDESVTYIIEDNGIGMDRETREKMFTLFFSSKGTKGTGLGMFIASKMVRQHGGEISVDSSLSEGSCFKVRLPRRQPRKESGSENG